MKSEMTFDRIAEFHRLMNLEWSTLDLNERMQLVVGFPHGAAATFLEHLSQSSGEKPVAWRSSNPDSIKSGQKYSDAENSTYFWSVLNHGQRWPDGVTLLYEHPSQSRTFADGEAVAWIEHHKGGDNLNWEPVSHPYAAATPLFAHPPIKEDLMVPDELRDMNVSWLGSRFLHLLEVSRKVPNWTGCEVSEGCVSDQEFNDAIEHVDRAIGELLLSAAPKSGGG